MEKYRKHKPNETRCVYMEITGLHECFVHVSGLFERHVVLNEKNRKK